MEDGDGKGKGRSFGRTLRFISILLERVLVRLVESQIERLM